MVGNIFKEDPSGFSIAIGSDINSKCTVFSRI